jgi:hypothetical protein
MEINWIAVLVATLVGALAGSLWFGPRTFFPLWWKEMGKDPNTPPGGQNMALVFGLTFAATAVQALIIALIVGGIGEVNWFAGLAVGALLGVLSASLLLPHKLFGSINLKVWVLEAGADVVGLGLMGLTIGLFG